MEEEKVNIEDENINTEVNTDNKKEAKKEKTSKLFSKKGQDDNTVKIEELGAKLAEVNDKYLRLYSEFDNFRKRTAKEKADLIKFGGEDVMKSLLPVIDDFERAIEAMENDSSLNSFKEGVILIYNKFRTTLEQKGLKPIIAKEQMFDENLHEAVANVPSTNEKDKGMVIDELEKGYYLNDKVIRYSKVVVAI